MLERDARIEPGADEIVHELLGRSNVERQARIVLTLPAEQITPGMAETLHAALRRYCEARLARVQRETEMAWRQGLRSLGTGSILFVVGAESAIRTIADSDTVRQDLHERLAALGYDRSVVVTFTADRRWAA